MKRILAVATALIIGGNALAAAPAHATPTGSPTAGQIRQAAAAGWEYVPATSPVRTVRKVGEYDCPRGSNPRFCIWEDSYGWGGRWQARARDMRGGRVLPSWIRYNGESAKNNLGNTYSLVAGIHCLGLAGYRDLAPGTYRPDLGTFRNKAGSIERADESAGTC